MIRSIGVLGAGAAAIIGAIPAQAVTIDRTVSTSTYTFTSYDAAGNLVPNNLAPNGADGYTNNDVAFYTATTSFDLPANFTNGRISLANFSADDRANFTVNGAEFIAVGIFASPTGTGGRFFYAPTGPTVTDIFYQNGFSGFFSSGLRAGVNTFAFTVNNTDDGIFGENRTGGRSDLNADVTVTFTTTAVPEPSSWAMFVCGFSLLGSAMRRRSAAIIAV